MIISHKHKFIFIKTQKTAGTSIEVFLSQHCGADDIITPVNPPVEPLVPQNHTGFWNPIPEMIASRGLRRWSVLRRLLKRRKFYNHISANAVRSLIPRQTWDGYFKFCVERNPWEKTLSHYHMRKDRAGGELSLDDYFQKGRFCLNYPIYTDNNGKLMVDRVIKYESLLEELAPVFSHLGIPFDGTLGVKAKSEHRKDRTPYQQVFSSEQKEIIENIFAKEIQMHRYAF